MSDPSNYLENIAKLFDIDQQSATMAQGILLTKVGEWVKATVMKPSEPLPGDFKTLDEEGMLVPLPQDAWRDPAEVEEILKDARRYADTDLSAADMNNLACANVWSPSPNKAVARDWLAKAKENKTATADQQAVIEQNATLLIEVKPPIEVPIAVFLKRIDLQALLDDIRNGLVDKITYEDAG